MEAVRIKIDTADRATLFAECERVSVANVTPRMRADTLRKKLRMHQQDYLLYVRWERLVRRLVGGSHGMTARPRPLTLDGMVDWAHDIMFKLLVADGYVGGTNDAKRYRDPTTRDIVRITSRQNTRNVNVIITNTGGSGSVSIMHAATCVFESIRRIVRQWEKEK